MTKISQYLSIHLSQCMENEQKLLKLASKLHRRSDNGRSDQTHLILISPNDTVASDRLTKLSGTAAFGDLGRGLSNVRLKR